MMKIQMLFPFRVENMSTTVIKKKLRKIKLRFPMSMGKKFISIIRINRKVTKIIRLLWMLQ